LHFEAECGPPVALFSGQLSDVKIHEAVPSAKLLGHLLSKMASLGSGPNMDNAWLEPCVDELHRFIERSLRIDL